MKMANSSAAVIENGDVSHGNVCLKGIEKSWKEGKNACTTKIFLTLWSLHIGYFWKTLETSLLSQDDLIF